MRISDAQLDTFRRDGFVIIERFLDEELTRSALAGFHREFSVTPEEWVAAGRRNTASGACLFPWEDRALNALCTHPDLVDAAERICGTREVRLCEGISHAVYPGEQRPEEQYEFHRDFGNNTLGPAIDWDEGNISIIVALRDITCGNGPTLLVPRGARTESSIPMVVPAGSIAIYSTNSTRHAASRYTASDGCRANLWICFCRKDRGWEGRWFTYKCGAREGNMRTFISSATTRQLELLGFPGPGDALWSDDFLLGMRERYPGFDPAPYLAARARCTAVTAGA
jgi:ectoine hydroxylase-related dioxygenase (phytanoyl-CoA dioxygenase family)